MIKLELIGKLDQLPIEIGERTLVIYRIGIRIIMQVIVTEVTGGSHLKD